MEDVLRLIIFLCLVFWHKVFAAPIQAHQSGGAEHIVIIDRTHPVPPGVAEVLQRLSLHEKHSDVRHIYNNSAFQGFAASMKSHCLDLLANMSDVSIVESTTYVAHAFATSKRDIVPFSTRPDAPWGLQRISTASTVGGSAQNLDYTYSYMNNQLGYGADIYIIDTGIYTENNIFGGRASMLWSFDGDMNDNDGHGTHVSGTAGGSILGVASNANIYGLKALNSEGGGWSSNVVAAIDQVIQNHDARQASGKNFLGSVMSLSLSSSGTVASIDSAVAAAIQAGIHTCVAAGNSNSDACADSPSSSGGTNGPAITVGAIDMNAELASFSNYGNCVDVYAPGVDVISSWIGGTNMVNSLSGTSMATPHVTGIVAYAMVNATLAKSPALMKEWISMTALLLSDGLLLANNGVVSGPVSNSEGMLGFAKIAAKPSFTTAGVADPLSPLNNMKRVSLLHTARGVSERSRGGLGAAIKAFTSVMDGLHTVLS